MSTDNMTKDNLTKIFGMPEMDSLHSYGDMYGNVRYYHRLKAQIVQKYILESAGQNKSLTLLDAGAGRGQYSISASSLFKKIYSFEFDKGEFEALTVNTAQNQNIECQQVDLTSIPLADNSVDTIVCSEVLEHIPDEGRAMSELNRVLKPGGTMLFSMPNAFSLFYAKVRMKPNHRALFQKLKGTGGLTYPEWEMLRHVSFPFWKIEELAHKHGFKIQSRVGANTLPIPYNLRKFFLTKLPVGLIIWTKIDSLIGKLIPQVGSFYFIRLQKNLK